MRPGHRRESAGPGFKSYLCGDVSVVGDVAAADHVAASLHAIAGHSVADNALNALARVCVGVVPATLLASRLIANCHAERLTEIYAARSTIVRWLNKVFAIALAVFEAIPAIKFCVRGIIESAE